ncbi:hypothetical protein HPB48_007145 [Haemaphysalis longicornis]|uniref:Uncharacterized protein n=1 Tax=Haemaphysalis longicornis TaxID=44386 RepID=A0A9J6GLB7_HAELO|nr:hypothetical protein HPB48_007145 [Haemaphysalis longicornis]
MRYLPLGRPHPRSTRRPLEALFGRFELRGDENIDPRFQAKPFGRRPARTHYPTPEPTATPPCAVARARHFGVPAILPPPAANILHPPLPHPSLNRPHVTSSRSGEGLTTEPAHIVDKTGRMNKNRRISAGCEMFPSKEGREGDDKKKEATFRNERRRGGRRRAHRHRRRPIHLTRQPQRRRAKCGGEPAFWRNQRIASTRSGAFRPGKHAGAASKTKLPRYDNEESRADLHPLSPLFRCRLRRAEPKAGPTTRAATATGKQHPDDGGGGGGCRENAARVATLSAHAQEVGAREDWGGS